MSNPAWTKLPIDKRSELRKAALDLGRKHFSLMIEALPSAVSVCVTRHGENTPVVRLEIPDRSTLDEVQAISDAVLAYAKYVWASRDIWELPLGDPDDPINIDKVRSPMQILMNMDEMASRVEFGCPEGYGPEKYCEQTMAFDDGYYSAFKYALIRTQDEINHLAEHGTGYVSYGDDTIDFFESGFDNGIAWAAGRFEWDAKGNIVEDSIKE
jgi:hypothetical protein